MKQYLLKIAFSGVLLTHSIIGMEDVGAQFSGLLEDAEMTSPLAAKAIHQEREFREAVIAQIDDLRGQIEEAQKAPKIEGPDKWKMKVLGQIEKDEAVTIALNARLKELADQKAIVSYPVKFNKISDIIAGVKHLLKSNFSDLLDGCIPTGYAYDQKTVTILGGNNDSTIWGNSRGTFLKTALMYILANKKEGVAGTFGSFGLPWYDRSALAHLTELPENLDLDLASYSFVCSYEEKAKLGLVTPHSGYAFGGHRCDSWRYPQGKKFGPQDCSSYVGSLTNSPAYTTADQLCAFRKLAGKPGLVPDGWEAGGDAQYLLTGTTVVTVKDPSMDILPGQIYCHRRFPAADLTMSGIGSGGHTAVVMGCYNGHIVTMGANRDMPKLEGFGLQNFSWAEEPLKQKMLFNVTGL